MRSVLILLIICRIIWPHPTASMVQILHKKIFFQYAALHTLSNIVHVKSLTSFNKTSTLIFTIRHSNKVKIVTNWHW